MSAATRVGVFGWGVVAPKSPNIEAFAHNLESSESWLTPFNGFGPDNFLVGVPEFDFGVYKEWIEARFPPNRFHQLVEKMDAMTLYAVGAFIQALGQNPGIEELLKELGPAAHVYVATGLGALPTIAHESLALHRAQRRWDRFWSAPENNAEVRAYQALSAEERAALPGVPTDPATVGEAEREDVEEAWWHYWAGRSASLADYLAELREIEGLRVEGNVESGKIALIKEKQRRNTRLQKKWGGPEPPWRAVSANILWNIHNTPASQISMLGRITGMTIAPVAACATFGVCLKVAMDAIQRGEAKLAVIGSADAPPHPLTVGAFYAGKVIAADGAVSKPLTELRGTHVAGGSAIWIVGDLEWMRERGFHPLGMEPVAVGVSADAHHIITPSRKGPSTAVRAAFTLSGLAPEEIATWDLHATATPGDYLEVDTLRENLPASVLVTARKGTFGHGMGACGGWELTAQYLGLARGELYPTPVAASELNAQIAGVHQRFVLDQPVACHGAAGKLSMGIGGINACVLSRPLD
jgi:3-oxoacyl-(acyl-carrier-protein) synthase